MMIIQTPWSNFEMAMTIDHDAAVTIAPTPLIRALRRQPGAALR